MKPMANKVSAYDYEYSPKIYYFKPGEKEKISYYPKKGMVVFLSLIHIYMSYLPKVEFKEVKLSKTKEGKSYKKFLERGLFKKETDGLNTVTVSYTHLCRQPAAS